MKGTEDKLRAELRGEPYINIRSWRDGLEFAGEEYLDELNEEKLAKIKRKLDIVISTGSEENLRSHYEDEIYP